MRLCFHAPPAQPAGHCHPHSGLSPPSCIIDSCVSWASILSALCALGRITRSPPAPWGPSLSTAHRPLPWVPSRSPVPRSDISLHRDTLSPNCPFLPVLPVLTPTDLLPGVRSVATLSRVLLCLSQHLPRCSCKLFLAYMGIPAPQPHVTHQNLEAPHILCDLLSCGAQPQLQPPDHQNEPWLLPLQLQPQCPQALPAPDGAQPSPPCSLDPCVVTSSECPLASPVPEPCTLSPLYHWQHPLWARSSARSNIWM